MGAILLIIHGRITITQLFFKPCQLTTYAAGTNGDLKFFFFFFVGGGARGNFVAYQLNYNSLSDSTSSASARVAFLAAFKTNALRDSTCLGPEYIDYQRGSQ